MVFKTIKESELDKMKLTSMKFKVIQLERLNVKTKQKSRNEMVDAIRKIIANEINKNI